MYLELIWQSLSLLFILRYALQLGVLALSWYPPDLSDDNGEATDHLVPMIMDKAHKYNLKVFNLFSNYFLSLLPLASNMLITHFN